MAVIDDKPRLGQTSLILFYRDITSNIRVKRTLKRRQLDGINVIRRRVCHCSVYTQYSVTNR